MKRIYIAIILSVICISLFWNIGRNSLSEWDESRNGMNAYEMYHNGDYVNLYYAGELDTWNAKPPLVIWGIMASYKIFGFNEFALRLVAAVSTILFFYVFFRFIEQLDTTLTAFITCLILLSCKAIVGWHVGLNGDFDATLILFLTLSAYSFYRYAEHGHKNQILLTGLFTGLAFYTKGTGGLVFIPGFFLYLLLSVKLKRVFNDKHTYLSLLILITIVVSWSVLLTAYGKTSAHSFYGSKNNLQTMLTHDTYRRLTDPTFETTTYKKDYLFFFNSLDVRMNVWNYLFYLTIAISVTLLYKNRKNLVCYIKMHKEVLFALCLIAPLTLVVNFATNKHDWYLAPVWGFVAFFIAKCTLYLGNKWKPYYFVFALLLFLFLFIRHIVYLQSLPKEMASVLKRNNKLLANTNYVVVSATPQNVLLNLTWMKIGFNRIDVTKELKQYKGQLLLIEKSKIDENVNKQIECKQQFDEWFLTIIK